ncbi:MAG: hypothetical protein AB7S69_14190 [Salinivirgaceae bacterium]
MSISYLKHEEIDKLKWDKCINRSFNGIVYAYSWYLDIVSYQWEALVLDDYDAVMPLPVRKNYTIPSLKQPNFTWQLGIFTSKLLDEKLVGTFLDAIPEKFRRIELAFNAFNKVVHPRYHIKNEFTYQLDLITPYKETYQGFSPETKEAIKRTKANKIQIVKQVNLKDFLLLKKHTGKTPLTFENLNMLRRIIPFTISYNLGEVFGAYSAENDLVAAAFFIKSHQKSILLLSACSDYGHEIQANVAIANSYIREYAERNMTLDFGNDEKEDSELFAKGFGAIPVNYPYLKKRNWFANIWFKKEKISLL